MEVGDMILYYSDSDEEKNDVGIVMKLTTSGRKASVLWASETVGLYFSADELERYPNNFKLIKKEG